MDLVLLFVGLFVFIGFFYSYWRTMCVDWARQLMFEERARLVSLVLANKMAFDSPEYRLVRRHIERSIRFLHAMTWPRFLMWGFLLRNNSHAAAGFERFRQTIDEIEDVKLRSEIRAICIRVGFAAMVCLMGRSIILGPAFLLLYLS